VGRGERHVAARAAWPPSTPPPPPPPPPPPASPQHCITGRRRMRIRGSGGASRNEIQEGREARRASICGRQPRRERTRFHRETDEFKPQDLDSDSSSTTNPSRIMRCQYPQLVRIRSGSAETEKTGRFSRHRETPRRISALQDLLSAFFFFSKYPGHRDQLCSTSWRKHAWNSREKSFFMRRNAWNKPLVKVGYRGLI